MYRERGKRKRKTEHKKEEKCVAEHDDGRDDEGASTKEVVGWSARGEEKKGGTQLVKFVMHGKGA
jgi:hypothetical protein